MSLIFSTELLFPLFQFLIGQRAVSPLKLMLVCKAWFEYILRKFCHPTRGLGYGLLYACRHGHLDYFRLWFEPKWLKKHIKLPNRGRYGCMLTHTFIARQALLEAVQGKHCGIIQELHTVGVEIFEYYPSETYLEIAIARNNCDFTLFVIGNCSRVYIPLVEPTPTIQELFTIYGLQKRLRPNPYM